MFSWLKNNNQELLLKLGGLSLAVLLLVFIILALGFNSTQMHYSNLQLDSELQKIQQDPLLKKYSAEPQTPEYPDIEMLRSLSAAQGLEFLSSKSGEHNLEIVLQGSYKNFLDYLQVLANENLGEISQIDFSSQGQGRLIIKSGGNYETK